MPSITTLRAGPALSGSRLQKITAVLNKAVPKLTRVTTEFVHLVQLETALDTAEQRRLMVLLDYGLHPAGDPLDGSQLLVVPRPGTRSPWSSKATDIAHNCGLHKVLRIERGVAWQFSFRGQADQGDLERLCPLIHDRMTEAVLHSTGEIADLFTVNPARAAATVDITQGGEAVLAEANNRMGLSLSAQEVTYLYRRFHELGRNPTDTELMMFAQANSEHCRHKIFNATWTVDGEAQSHSLFQMIKHTHQCNPGGVLSAYSDNAAVTRGYAASRFFADPEDRVYGYTCEDVHLLVKVETHNHPTAISPYPGAATGAGGEIRDEAATGRGAKPKAGLTGFSVSNLRIPGFIQPWEQDHGRLERQASALEIMLQGPIGAASYNNEFGRPALCGYFRSYEQVIGEGADAEVRGYHKPIMLAGGYGNIRADHVIKQNIPPLAKVIVLGGPAMLIGLGGGAASSIGAGRGDQDLDFASVQRDNAEMQRRCQEVIDTCWGLGDANPIVSIHDVGAGGLSNAIPELLADSERGGRLELAAIPNEDPAMSPLEIWCNEAQERYVLAISPDSLDLFERICARERCPFAVVGEAGAEQQLVLSGPDPDHHPIDIPMDLLFGGAPRREIQARRNPRPLPKLRLEDIAIAEAAERVLRLPTVADKGFLITIGDRTVSGLVVRDQMVGPWQIPVADCAVTAASYRDYTGEAMAVGERTPIAVIDAAASARMAVGEAITNIAAARIVKLEDIVLSANWMAAGGSGDEDARLFQAVRAVGMQLCPALGIAIPVGKDSLSMQTRWQDNGEQRVVTSPMSLVVSAFAPVADVRLSLTPQLRTDAGDSTLILIDLGRGKNRLGGSCLAQVYNQVGDCSADLDRPEDLKSLFRAIQVLSEMGLILAYHDRSDGGLFVTLCEMALAARSGLDIDLGGLGTDPLAALFSEELGAVIQVRREDTQAVVELFHDCEGLADHVHPIGVLRPSRLSFRHNGTEIYTTGLMEIQALWSETSFRMRALRDDPDCARQEYDALQDPADPGLSLDLSWSIKEDRPAPSTARAARPAVAVLREQGVNGHLEMAAAFERAGFDCMDIHMTDVIAGRVRLDRFVGLACCGGFSYGDVLGAGGGWAKSILYNPRASDEFSSFFQRQDTFTLGVCNGCQMLSQLKTLIPGAEQWPTFVQNRSEQFEARLVMVEVLPSPSILLQGMGGSRIPIVVAHGEGRLCCDEATTPEIFLEGQTAVLRYIDNQGNPSETYPANPNGSPAGLTGLTSGDGRVTIMMPHPERVFLAKQYSWLPAEWDSEDGPWMQMFRNARRWVGS